MIIKKCEKCGALVKVFKDCTCDDCGIKCCGEQLKELVPNTVEASYEKHIPKYEIKDGRVLVNVEHVMEDIHYIEWICASYGNKEETVYFKPGEKAYAEFEYKENMTIYAYCNLHELWMTEVE